MFCGHCGHKKTGSDHLFCTACGKPYDTKENHPLENPSIQDERPPPHKLPPGIKIKAVDGGNYDTDILSVAAGKTKNIVDRYQIHSCPDRYTYRKTKYITFRERGTGQMDALYEIKKILIIPTDARDNLNILDQHGLSVNEVERLTGYMKENPFPENDRYYILFRSKSLPHKPRPSEVNAKTLYYSLDAICDSEQTESGKLPEDQTSSALSDSDNFSLEIEPIKFQPAIKQDSYKSKYLCVYWIEDSKLPWRAKSLDHKFLLGDYKLEKDAARAVANFHKIGVISLEVTSKWKEKREEFRKSLIGKIYGSESAEIREMEREMPETKAKYTDDKPVIQEYFEAALGEATFYVSQFVKFHESGVGIKSWNWAAFLVVPWYLYRKLYGLFVIIFCVSYFDFKIATSNVPDPTKLVSHGLALFIYILCAVKANQAYYKKVINSIEKGKRLYPNNKEKLISYLRVAPMVNEWVFYFFYGLGALSLLISFMRYST